MNDEPFETATTVRASRRVSRVKLNQGSREREREFPAVILHVYEEERKKGTGNAEPLLRFDDMTVGGGGGGAPRAI
jgi:hypothetical protein